MRRNHNQIDALLCSSLIDCGWAVSGHGNCIDRNPIEIDAFQESLHPIATSAPRCFQISRGMVIAAGRRHHYRAEIGDVQDDEARTNLLGEFDRILQTYQGTVREVDRNQNATNRVLALRGRVKLMRFSLEKLRDGDEMEPARLKVRNDGRQRVCGAANPNVQ